MYDKGGYQIASSLISCRLVSNSNDRCQKFQIRNLLFRLHEKAENQLSALGIGQRSTESYRSNLVKADCYLPRPYRQSKNTISLFSLSYLLRNKAEKRVCFFSNLFGCPFGNSRMDPTVARTCHQTSLLREQICLSRKSGVALTTALRLNSMRRIL